MRLEKAWDVDHRRYGVFEGVDVDQQTGDVYAALSRGVVRFDRDGKELARTRFDEHDGGRGDFRLANLDGDAPLDYVVSGVWSRQVNAFAADGKLLWSYERPDGVDEMWAYDLDGDKRDEVIVGYNAKGGIQVVNPDGTQRWKSDIVGNVWSVTAGPTGPNGEIRVLCPGRGFDKVQAFEPDGKALPALGLGAGQDRAKRSGLDAHWVRVGRIDAGPVTLVSDYRARTLACLDQRGSVLWRRSFPGGNRAGDMMASPDRPWFALILDEAIVVHDAKTGDRLTKLNVPHARKLAWAPAGADRPPMLVVEAFNMVIAYTVQGTAAAPDAKPPDLAGMGLPAPDPERGQPVAWFQGKYVYPNDLANTDLQGVILATLLQEFAQERRLNPTEAQIESFKRWFERNSPRQDKDNVPEGIDDMLAESSVRQWLISKALHEKYGGTVVFQQGNPLEPVGALRKFLEEHEAAGSFKILDPEHKEMFWSYYLREHPMEVPKEQVDFSRPWWEQMSKR